MTERHKEDLPPSMNFDKWAKSIFKHGTNAEYGIAKAAWDAGAKAEREACVKICDELHQNWHWGGDNPVSGPRECADAIRKRSLTQE